MTREQERVLAQIEANDPHPERGEIKFATDRVVGDYFERESFKNNFEGVSERLYERWYTTGELSLQRVYKDGLLDSHNSWYPNGQLFERCSYKNGLPDGLEERWHENGQLMERTHFCAGKLDGLREEWYDNGQLSSQCSFKNNTPSGLWKLWHDNGQMSSRYTYNNGKVDGLLERWHENGQLSERITFKNGREDGLYECWHISGRLEDRCMFKDGRLCNQQPKVVVPSSPVQEQAQAILAERGERNDNTLNNAQEEQVERKSQSHKISDDPYKYTIYVYYRI